LKPRTPFLLRQTVERHLNQLDTSSAAVEKDLNIAYDDIFKRNTADGTLEHYHASKIYKMLLCCKQPFSIAAITTAVAFNEDNSPGYESIDHAYVRQLTQDFIVETERGTLEFAHVSVKDYLQGEHQSDYSDAKCDAQVALTCLKYISSQDRATYEVIMQSNEFLQYSHRFWGEHCAQLNKEDRQSLGVSKELLGWIIERSGSTTFQDWLHAAEKFPQFSTRSFTSDSGSPVFSACDWNLVEVLEKLLSADPAYNLNLNPDDKGYRPLSLASYRGHKAVVKLLLEKGAAVDAPDKDGRTPLHWALWSGHVEVVKLLLEKGAAVDATDKDGRTPLHWALWNGHVEVVKLLLKKGAAVDAVDGEGEMPLHWASERGHVEVVKLLLEKGAAVDAADGNGETPLHWALWNGHIEVIKLLLEKGAAVDAADGDGETPLYRASEHGHVEVVKLLSGSG
jgi:ankyrin repeat protein